MLLLLLLSKASPDAGMVSMLPTVNPDLFKIDGGNVQVPQMLLDHAHPDLHKANVTRIVRSSDGTFHIETLQQGSSHVGSVYCICQHIAVCCNPAMALSINLSVVPRLLTLIADLCMLHCHMLSYLVYQFDVQRNVSPTLIASIWDWEDALFPVIGCLIGGLTRTSHVSLQYTTGDCKSYELCCFLHK